MDLFHVGFDVIKEPDLHYGRRNADFGQGFYTTPDNDFAYRWARTESGKDTIINKYILNEEGLNIKYFSRNEEWYEYIYSNRNGKKDILNADVIVGPIANDIIYDTLGITTSGFLSKNEAMKLFMIGPEYIQVVIKSEKAKSNLKWISSEVITSEQLSYYHGLMKKEEDEFQKRFAETLEAL